MLKKFNITEERINEVVKELMAEMDYETIGKPKWLEDDIAHISNNRICLSPAIGSVLFSNRTVRTFHVTSVQGIKGIKQLVQQRKPISSFTFMSHSMVSHMGGIQTSGGVIFEVLGKTLYAGMNDIMSRTDQRGKRWLDIRTVMPYGISDKFKSMVQDWIDKNEKELETIGMGDTRNREQLRLVAEYFIMSDDYVKQHSEEIRKHALSRNLGGSYNEIVVHDIKVRDVLWTTTKLDWGKTFEDLKRKVHQGRELNDSEREFAKECRRKIHEIDKELKEFCTGEIRHTDDTHNAIIWVLEKGGNTQAEEYQKKLEKMRKDNIYKEDI